MRLRTDSLHRKGRYVRVSVIANATGDSQGIMSMLAELEAEIPVLAIRELILSQPEPGGPSDRPEAIRMDITIEGIARNPLPRFMVPRSPRGGAR
jgi:hypothetical protein